MQVYYSSVFVILSSKLVHTQGFPRQLLHFKLCLVTYSSNTVLDFYECAAAAQQLSRFYRCHDFHLCLILQKN